MTPDRLFPTSVVGSYAVPEWLANAKTDFFQRKLSRSVLDEIQSAALKAALKDQELAGIDVVTDGEVQRDNSLDYFLVRLPGVEIDGRAKAYYLDFFTTVVRAEIAESPLGLAEDFQAVSALTSHAVKCTITGAYSMLRRLRDEHYGDRERLGLALSRAVNFELRRLQNAGCRFIQIDDEYVSGYPEDIGWAIELINRSLEGIHVKKALHVCFGNRYGKPSWAGDYRYLVPAVFDARIDQLILEFARRGYDDLKLFGSAPPFEIGLGVIDVKDRVVESPVVVAERIRAAARVVPREKLWINPDCGLRHLPGPVARAKLRAMVEGARLAANEMKSAA
ncbi:MAG: uroporphyrinogen decarboxylase/cobalamine-independent methonine synthase family protein [Chloroflexota bacterium]